MSGTVFCVPDVVPEQMMTHLTAKRPERPSELHVELSCKLQQHKPHRYVFTAMTTRPSGNGGVGHESSVLLCSSSHFAVCLREIGQRISAYLSRSRRARWGWSGTHLQPRPDLEWLWMGSTAATVRLWVMWVSKATYTRPIRESSWSLLNRICT